MTDTKFKNFSKINILQRHYDLDYSLDGLVNYLISVGEKLFSTNFIFSFQEKTIQRKKFRQAFRLGSL